jgi:hypothetical protein
LTPWQDGFYALISISIQKKAVANRFYGFATDPFFAHKKTVDKKSLHVIIDT